MQFYQDLPSFINLASILTYTFKPVNGNYRFMFIFRNYLGVDLTIIEYYNSQYLPI